MLLKTYKKLTRFVYHTFVSKFAETIKIDMKKIIFSTLLMVCSVMVFGQKYESYGKKISEKGAKPLSSIESKESFSGETVKVEGEVEGVCQMKGCWMTIKKSDGSTMTVKFKDYDFFVPMDIAGKKVIIEGVPTVKTTSVAELKHYAEDAKKSKEEIAKITEPKTELRFMADGVLVQKN